MRLSGTENPRPRPQVAHRPRACVNVPPCTKHLASDCLHLTRELAQRVGIGSDLSIADGTPPSKLSGCTSAKGPSTSSAPPTRAPPPPSLRPLGPQRVNTIPSAARPRTATCVTTWTFAVRRTQDVARVPAVRGNVTSCACGSRGATFAKWTPLVAPTPMVREAPTDRRSGP